MVADGLTKPLPWNKWNKFLDKLGLVDMKERLGDRQVDMLELQEHMELLETDSGI
ncbi:hypothetical protein EJ04DRAFT_516725, partial [Polyplosphaeria fusca]